MPYCNWLYLRLSQISKKNDICFESNFPINALTVFFNPFPVIHAVNSFDTHWRLFPYQSQAFCYAIALLPIRVIRLHFTSPPQYCSNLNKTQLSLYATSLILAKLRPQTGLPTLRDAVRKTNSIINSFPLNSTTTYLLSACVTHKFFLITFPTVRKTSQLRWAKKNHILI